MPSGLESCANYMYNTPTPEIVVHRPLANQAKPPSPAASTAVIEYELLTLARWLEMLSRRSAIYDRIDRAGYLVLRTIAAGSRRTTDIAEVLGLDPSTATRQISVLETAGLVQRGSDPTDGRASRLAPSVEGQEVLEEVERRRRELLDALLEDWDHEARASFAQGLLRLNRSLRTYPWPERQVPAATEPTTDS